MFLLRLFTFVGIAIVLVILVTQVLVPMVTGSVLFPALRKKREQLLNEKAEVSAQIDEVELESNVVSLKQKLAQRQAALRSTEEPVPPANQKS